MRRLFEASDSTYGSPRIHLDLAEAGWAVSVNTEIGTDEGKLYLAHVIDLCSRRLLAAAMSEHPDAVLAADAIKIAAAVRGGPVGDLEGVIFHTQRGSTYTAKDFRRLCAEQLGIRQSMGRVGSCFDCENVARRLVA